MRNAIFIALLILPLGTGLSRAQDETRLPRMIDSGGGAVIFSDRGVGFNVMQGGASLTYSSRSEENKTITTGRSSDYGEFEIVEDEFGNISVTLTEEMGVEDADAVRDMHPELAMYLQGIPDQVGDSQVEVFFRVKTTYQAEDAEGLRKQSEAAYQLYDEIKHGRMHGFGGIRRRPGGGLIRLPKLTEIRPGTAPVPEPMTSMDGREVDNADLTNRPKAEGPGDDSEAPVPEKIQGDSEKPRQSLPQMNDPRVTPQGNRNQHQQPSQPEGSEAEAPGTEAPGTAGTEAEGTGAKGKEAKGEGTEAKGTEAEGTGAESSGG